ncbi:helix-turn-helix transcriptional regulator [Actinocorallia longicatena]|uniref:HTH cro/C1-type domain-containing protein n=1 Tax=Actinocorallia longicatena TaxID=111803 RepID=A0ABP6PYB7_9ACTN
MPASPSSSAQAARQRLAAQLREMRRAAGITGVQFAREAGWADSSLASAIELGKRTITVEHVRLWCRICGASGGLTTDLLAEQAQVAGMWVTYQQLNRGGLKGAQKSIRQVYEELTLARSYQPKVFSGMVQTEDYTRAAMAGVVIEQGVDVENPAEDLAAAVAERMDRQTMLNRTDAKWLFLMEEWVLWVRPYPPQVHREQLRHLLEVMRRPNVVVGIIPMNTFRRGIHPEEAFDITDSHMATVELASGYLSVTRPDEVRMYTELWDRLWSLATFKNAAALIERAMDR